MLAFSITMKLCGISDIHGEFINIPECDVLCIAGDIMPLYCQRNINDSRLWMYNRFTEWVKKLPCKKVILTGGNHDFLLEHAVIKGYINELKQDLSLRTDNKLVILINEEYTYEGKKFYGCPYIEPVTFQVGKWAFETVTSDVYMNIPEDVDVLITHDSPIKSVALNFVMCTKQFKINMIHFYGHWHDGPTIEAKNQYNCAYLNEMYNPKKDYKPITVELMDEKRELVVQYEFIKELIKTFHDYWKETGIETYTDMDVIHFLNVQKEKLEEKLHDEEDEANIVTQEDNGENEN